MSDYKRLYREIWDQRKKTDMDGGEYANCESEDCPTCGGGGRIYESQIAIHNFAHAFGKNVAPELRYDKTNVRIVHFSVHQKDHISGESKDLLPIQ